VAVDIVSLLKWLLHVRASPGILSAVSGRGRVVVSRDQTKGVSTKRCCSVPSYGGGEGQVIYRAAECQGTLV
jgi:hypothetical protein